jgi:hypothetical protein
MRFLPIYVGEVMVGFEAQAESEDDIAVLFCLAGLKPRVYGDGDRLPAVLRLCPELPYKLCPIEPMMNLNPVRKLPKDYAGPAKKS